jgi:Flp pilus assembly protein TadG
LPSDITKKLSDALYQAATSATVQEWSKKSKKPLEPLDSAAATKVMAELSGFYTKYKSILAN